MLVASFGDRNALLELFIALLVLSIRCTGVETASPSNAAEVRGVESGFGSEALARSKRYLVWNPLSFIQITVALAIPMKEVREKSKNVGVAFDIQGNYPLPTNAAVLDPGYIPVIAGSRRIVRDLTLQDAYQSFEDILYGQGFNGRACLRQAICMAAEIPISKDNLHEELIHLFLSPVEIGSGVASHYVEAQDLGESGVNCRDAFPDCKTPILDVVSRIWDLDSPKDETSTTSHAKESTDTSRSSNT